MFCSPIPYLSVLCDPLLATVLWADEEWADMRIALTCPIKEPAVAISDVEKRTTIWLNKPWDGADGHRARAKAIPFVSGKAIPYVIALKEY